MSLSYLSVCSGIEAAAVAWHPLGWRPLAFSEIEAFPRAVLAHHYPEVPCHGDFTTIQRSDYGQPDILVGGTPCQSFSVAGLRGGMADERGNLALEYLMLAGRVGAEWLVWENVPGVLSSNGGRDFGSFLGGMGQLGYGFAYRVLDAQFAGVPQRRRRVFVVGYLGDWRRAAAVLFERHSLQGHPPPSREAGERVADSLMAGANHCRGWPGDFVEASTGDTSHCLNAGGMRRQDYETETLVTHSLRGEGFDASEDGTGRGTPLVPVAFDWQGSGKQTTLGASEHGAGALGTSKVPAVAFAENSRNELRLCGGDGSVAAQLTTGGGKPGQGMPCVAFQERGRTDGLELEIGGDIAYALTSPNGGGRAQERNVLTPSMSVRRLTPTECERLQGFPDGYTLVPYRGKPASDGPRYKALGNSMAVPVMRWIGERIAMVERIPVAARAAA